MHILEELWNGNISPTEGRQSSEYQIVITKFDEEKQSLLSDAPEEVQELLLFERQIYPNAIAERDAFVCGFRLAVQLFADGLFR